MEIAIGIGIGMIIALIAGKKRRGHKQTSNVDAEAERKRLQQADEELITVVLPTINHDS